MPDLLTRLTSRCKSNRPIEMPRPPNFIELFDKINEDVLDCVGHIAERALRCYRVRLQPNARNLERSPRPKEFQTK